MKKRAWNFWTRARPLLWNFWTRAQPLLLAFVSWLGLYLDDLLLIAAGVCFTLAADRAFGSSAALAVAGTCCLGYGVVVARSKRGGGKP